MEQELVVVVGAAESVLLAELARGPEAKEWTRLGTEQDGSEPRPDNWLRYSCWKGGGRGVISRKEDQDERKGRKG